MECGIPVLSSILSGAGYRSSLLPTWSPLVFFSYFLVEEYNGTRYQRGSFSLINVGIDFYCLRSYLFFNSYSIIRWSTKSVPFWRWVQNPKGPFLFKIPVIELQNVYVHHVYLIAVVNRDLHWGSGIVHFRRRSGRDQTSGNFDRYVLSVI